MRKNKVYIETLGCSKNLVDSEHMIGILKHNQYEFVSDPNEAGVIIINTCSFIHDAKQESIDTIISMTNHNDSFLIVAGCLAQRYANELLDEIPEIDAYVGTSKYHIIDEVIEKLKSGERNLILTDDISAISPEGLPRTLTTPKYFAYVKIAEGCDNRCTYCIIPKLRGNYRSRTIEAIVQEVTGLVENGVKEIILIAQDTTRYGIDIYNEYRLKDLLEQLNSIEGLRWIRIQYMYPDVIDEELIISISKLDKVVKYFDIPIQHSSNKILKLMNRHTTKENIIDVLTLIKTHIKNAVLRTTIIVGFPGETQGDFEDLLYFIQEYPFHRLGAFTYSLEENTPAFKLPNQLDDELKEIRHQQIMAVQQAISMKMMHQFTGQELEVIIEEKVQNEAIYMGRTLYDTPDVDGIVYVHTQRDLTIGEIYDVKITDSMEYDLMGEI